MTSFENLDQFLNRTDIGKREGVSAMTVGPVQIALPERKQHSSDKQKMFYTGPLNPPTLRDFEFRIPKIGGAIHYTQVSITYAMSSVRERNRGFFAF